MAVLGWWPGLLTGLGWGKPVEGCPGPLPLLVSRGLVFPVPGRVLPVPVIQVIAVEDSLDDAQLAVAGVLGLA